ncbi:hypothetical protein ACFFX0_30015 [Citricoccus parietis]|uniref:Uncharacterized protein n=1 Tax=Citricoccus parietis TaxID=592307 RepID=A0ABV5G965_9MICC
MPSSCDTTIPTFRPAATSYIFTAAAAPKGKRGSRCPFSAARMFAPIAGRFPRGLGSPGSKMPGSASPCPPACRAKRRRSATGSPQIPAVNGPGYAVSATAPRWPPVFCSAIRGPIAASS